MAAIPESAKLFMPGLIERARKLKRTIVFPEGTDPRVLEAAARLAREGVVKLVLIGPRRPNHRRVLRSWTRRIRSWLTGTPRCIMNGGVPRELRRWRPRLPPGSRCTSLP